MDIENVVEQWLTLSSSSRSAMVLEEMIRMIESKHNPIIPRKQFNVLVHFYSLCALSSRMPHMLFEVYKQTPSHNLEKDVGVMITMVRRINKQRHDLLTGIYTVCCPYKERLQTLYAMLEKSDTVVDRRQVPSGGCCWISSAALTSSNGAQLTMGWRDNHEDHEKSYLIDTRFVPLLNSFFIVRHIDQHIRMLVYWWLQGDAMLSQKACTLKMLFQHMGGFVLTPQAYKMYASYISAWGILQEHLYRLE